MACSHRACTARCCSVPRCSRWGAGPSPDKARADLFERVAASLRVRQDGPDVTQVIDFPS